MDIVGKITGIKYQVLFTEVLKEVKIKNFDINEMPSSCLLKSNKHTFAISKWVSPKRTRSYPFERVYNTLHISRKITVIPVVKDEGAKGDRDFIQWDTVSLMSLLDVFVIFAYYDNAEKADDYPIKTEIQRRSPVGSRKWAKNDFFQDVYMRIDAIKDAQRNQTMHVESIYTEDEASLIFKNTQAFMQKIASQMDESGLPVA